MVSPRKKDPSGKKVSKLFVEPAELARKLIKELEGTKSSHGGQTWVREQYTVFLCREDFARLRSHLDQLVRKLESHMERHVQNKRYATSGAITIELTMDPDLKPGYFGVLAERADLGGPPAQGGASGRNGQSVWDVPDESAYDDEYVTERPGAGGFPAATRGPAGAPGAPSSAGGPSFPPAMPPMAPPLMPPAMPPSVPSAAPPLPRTADGMSTGAGAAGSTPPSLAGQQPQQPAQPAPPPIQPSARPPMVPPVPASAGPARSAAAGDGSPGGSGTETLVLKVNGQERVYPEGKAVVGRSRDVDLQIENADVSRRHAVIYCSEGSVVVKDLGSTNGTMVNGYPIDSTVVRPSDVIRIGNAHITAASG